MRTDKQQIRRTGYQHIAGAHTLQNFDFSPKIAAQLHWTKLYPFFGIRVRDSK
jgi:hypothetical protein